MKLIAAIKSLLGLTSKVDFGDLISKGAIIVDVRSKKEYAGGHLKNSKNIPLPILKNYISTLNKNSAVITCCASGMRSRSAVSILQSAGFAEVYNGGSWSSLKKFDR